MLTVVNYQQYGNSSTGMEQEILNFIGKVIAYGGSSVAIAFVFFRFLGKKWIEGKFSERLEAYKHAQAKELEEAKFQINSLFSRVSKLHDKEFEVLPNAWEKLNDARAAILKSMFRFRQHPDFDKMSDEELDSFLKNTKFSESQKENMRQSGRKNDCYGKITTWREIGEAQEAFNEFHFYLTKNRIFLNSDLKAKFDAIDTLMWEMWVAIKVGEECGDALMSLNKFQECDEPIKNLMKEIEALVQTRLYPL